MAFSHSMADSEADRTTVGSKMEDKSDGFVPVKAKSRKRKMGDMPEGATVTMDTSESAPKRPSLPPISGDKLMVRRLHICLLHSAVWYWVVQ